MLTYERQVLPEPHVLHVRDPEGLAGPDDLVVLVDKLVPDGDGEHGLALDAEGDLVADVGPVILGVTLILALVLHPHSDKIIA